MINSKIFQCNNATLIIFWSSIFFICFTYIIAKAQPRSVLKIQEIVYQSDENRIELRMYAKKGDQKFNTNDFQTILVQERAKGEAEFQSLQTERPNNAPITKIKNELTVLFLLDASGSMKKTVDGVSKMDKAKAVIRNTVNSFNLPPNSYLVSFSDSINGTDQLINRGNIEEKLAAIHPQGETDLNHALLTKLQELEAKKGQKLIILVSDGRNDVLNIPEYERGARIPVSPDFVLSTVEKLPDDFRIYTIGLGDPSATDEGTIDEPFLKDLALRTKSPKDAYSYASSPNNLDSIFQIILVDNLVNVVWWFYPENKTYNGTRYIKVFGLLKADANIDSIKRDTFYGTKDYVLTSIIDSPPVEQTTILKLFFIGLLLIFATLASLIFLLPTFGFQAFKSKFIMKFGEYRKRNNLLSKNIKHQDPYSGDFIEDEDLVVTICEHIMKIDSWQANKDRCVNYPNSCTKGVANYNTRKNFFRQQGANRKINWLWFGAVGGFFTWLMQTLLNLYSPPSFSNFFKLQFGGYHNFFLVFITGLSIGFMLIFFLALAEELGQSRSFSFWRILKRALIGTCCATFILFTAEFWRIEFSTFRLQPLIDFLAWALLGAVMGMVVSFFSSIEAYKGIRGGVIAGIIALLIKTFFSVKLPDGDSHFFGQLLTFLSFGAIFGLLIVSVVERISKFDLEYLGPAEWNGRKIAITKWLSSDGQSILLGRDKSCEVLLNLPGIEDKHARMSFNGLVHISPYDEQSSVYINNRQIKQATQLNDGDIIKLGDSNDLRLRFNAQKKAPLVDEGLSLSNIEEEIKKQIKINIKN